MRRSLSLTALCLFAVATLGLVDVRSGPDIGFSLFYLIPVVVASWNESPSTMGSLVRLRLPRATRTSLIRPATA